MAESKFYRTKSRTKLTNRDVSAVPCTEATAGLYYFRFCGQSSLFEIETENL